MGGSCGTTIVTLHRRRPGLLREQKTNYPAFGEAFLGGNRTFSILRSTSRERLGQIQLWLRARKWNVQGLKKEDITRRDRIGASSVQYVCVHYTLSSEVCAHDGSITQRVNINENRNPILQNCGCHMHRRLFVPKHAHTAAMHTVSKSYR